MREFLKEKEPTKKIPRMEKFAGHRILREILGKIKNKPLGEERICWCIFGTDIH
ncbi:hypothetical protein ES703_55160 [subsurface metagenome]